MLLRNQKKIERTESEKLKEFTRAMAANSASSIEQGMHPHRILSNKQGQKVAWKTEGIAH